MHICNLTIIMTFFDLLKSGLNSILNSKRKLTFVYQSRDVSSSPFWWVRVVHLFSFFELSYYVSLRFEFRVVVSVTIST